MDAPLVSILIPVYNRQNLVATALESAIAQTYENIEVVVVDNCSTDHTYDVITSFAARDGRVRCYRNSENIGPVPNWIKCLEYSRGDFVKILFSDDWLDTECIQRHIEPFLDGAEIGLSYSTVALHKDDEPSQLLYFRPASGEIAAYEYLAEILVNGRDSTPVSPGCAMFRRKDLVKWLIPTFADSSDLRCAKRGIGPDLLLFLRACEHYPKIYYCHYVLNHFRAHGGSITINEQGSNEGIVDVCYDVAFGWFLANSQLPDKERRQYNTLLLIRSMTPARFRSHRTRNPWRVYQRVFPSGYAISQLDILSPKAINASRIHLGRLIRARFG